MNRSLLRELLLRVRQLTDQSLVLRVSLCLIQFNNNKKKIFIQFFRDYDVEKEKEIVNKKCITTFLGKLLEST